MLSSDLVNFWGCRYWLLDLNRYLLFVSEGDGKGLNQTIATQNFFKEKSEDAEYCRALLLDSACQLLRPDNIHNNPIYIRYLEGGGVGTLTYKEALSELALREKYPCPFNDNRFETQRRFIEALRKFREATINFLKGKKKPDYVALSPDEVIELIKKFFAYEVVFSAPQY